MTGEDNGGVDVLQSTDVSLVRPKNDSNSLADLFVEG